MLYYTGIGSRKTPDDVLDLMERLARYLARQDWVLHSGHASGADQAFERGASQRAQIFLPWRNFEDDVVIPALFVLPEPDAWTFEIAAQHHPAWDRLSQGARKLHARNVHQIYGPQKDHSPISQCVVCWTSDGKASGGTGQALRIAESLGIQILNLQRKEDRVVAEEVA